MKKHMIISTDLALEERERFEDNVEIPGVVLKKRKTKSGNIITKMVIKNEKGAKTMQKPVGTYITIEAGTLYEEGDDSELTKIICSELKKVEKLSGDKKILIVGLGNEQATPDALGPIVAKNIEIKENVVCIVPGVLAQTGMETYKIVKGIVGEERPDIIIAIDSLAARNTNRVATTIQITNTGIIPGSGIGNHRMGLNKETLGVPVIAVGVPMVVNSVTIVHDTLEQIIDFLSHYKELMEVTNIFSVLNRDEKYELIDDIMSNGMAKMYVTPKDIDEIVHKVGTILSKAINMSIA